MKNSEIKILNVLKIYNRPMCAMEIVSALPDMKEITIRKGIQSLLKDDVICVSGKVQNTKNYARTFIINPQYEQAHAGDDAALPHTNIFHFACALVENTSLSDEELLVLQKIIDERIQKK
ncbi:MAG TPA: hypothetical protein DCZ23_01935 [Lachnospiraceae bacterium]|nr:hypothetical protein [Lachnospiraceae bacterium]